MASDMDTDDPWDWSIDRVVQELCTSNRTWEPQSNIKNKPNLHSLEEALREQEVTGSVLLQDVDDNVLRQDFGLKVLGHRSFVNDCIRVLRVKSIRYQNNVKTYQPDQVRDMLELLLRQNSSIASSANGHRSLPPNPATPISEHSRRPSNDYVVADEAGQKRRKLDLNLGPASDDEHAYEPIPGSETPQDLVITDSPAIDYENDKKRKRIAPTLITSEIELLIPEVDYTDEPDSLESDEPTDNAIDLRLKASDKARSPVTAMFSNSNGAATGYLGKKKMPVDQIFYSDNKVGDELLDAEESHAFSIPAYPNISSGRRLHMHSIMKHFLRTEQLSFERGGKSCIAIRPYPAKLAPKFQQPSQTIYFPTSEGIHARRETYNPDVSDHQTTTDEHVAVFNPLGPDMFQGFGASEWDESCLEKYKHLEGGDLILPVYGESDEENEYDLETWKEIEAELAEGQELERGPLRKTRKPQLTAEEVSDGVDEGLADLVTEWQGKVFPKRELRAWSIWRKSRRRQNKREQINSDQEKLNERLRRIEKMKNEIKSDVWTSKLQVKKQTRIMEIDVFAREDLLWRISILERKTCPEKTTAPTQAIISSPKGSVISDAGEEGESIQTDVEIFSSDDDEFDDFIVPDETSFMDGDRLELSLADSEPDMEEDAALSDTSEEEIIPPGRRRKHQNFRRSIEDSDVNIHDNSEFSDVEASTPRVREVSQEVKDEVLSKKIIQRQEKGPAEVIDLTMISSDESFNEPSANDSITIDLVTPVKKTPRIKLFHRDSPLRESPLSLSDYEVVDPDPENLPPYNNPSLIARTSYDTWTKLGDRERLLIKVVYSMNRASRTSIFDIVREVPREEFWPGAMGLVVEALIKEQGSSKGMDAEVFQSLCNLTTLFYMFITCTHVAWRDVLLRAQLNTVASRADDSVFVQFYNFICKLEGFFASRPTSLQLSSPTRSPRSRSRNNHDSDIEMDEDNEETPPLVKRRPQELTTTDEETPPDESSPKKKKKKLFENVEARDLREQDRLRLIEQEQRRKRLLRNLEENGNSQIEDIIVNDARTENQGIVTIHPHIAPRIKKHQVDGVRFMWNQIVSGNINSMQGCLLAHTMGLGKSMQVITLLVAIAQSASDKTLLSQIPEGLRVSRTLILCPPSLIDNWMDELLTWIPDGILGDLRKIDAHHKPWARIRAIDKWSRQGGVLVLGYEMFRLLLGDKFADSVDQSQHAKMKKQLFESPNVVVADEAHKLKNSKAGITLAASQFRTSSRIALTGSPLANNIEEYHSMIEWVAPNYLGPLAEFRAKYVQPIQAGLYMDSSASDKRRSLKMLEVLKEDIGPKVHRADMSVLRNDLPTKKEFVITVPLTEVQRKAYSLYVNSVLNSSPERNKDGTVTQTTLWHWLAILSLLCNHPYCFDSKLHERKEKAKQAASNQLEVTDLNDAIASDLNAPIWKVGVSQQLVNDTSKLFTKEAQDLTDFELSNKVRMLRKILDASRAAKDKVLVFTQSIPTLDFLVQVCKSDRRKYARLDGKTKMNSRQSAVKNFNEGDCEVYLISTTAGGLGLNLQGANRVVIFDFKFNPIMEEQAVGRAYRIGQTKPTFVYRFLVGGTFEGTVHNKTIFKMQLASRVIDKKNPISHARKKMSDFLFEPREVDQEDLSEFKGMDPQVLGHILDTKSCDVRSIVMTETFEQDEKIEYTAEELREMRYMLGDARLKRDNPQKWHAAQAAGRLVHTPSNQERPQYHQAPAHPNPLQASTRPLPPVHPNPLQSPMQPPAKQPAAAPINIRSAVQTVERPSPPQATPTPPSAGGTLSKGSGRPNKTSPAQDKQRSASVANPGAHPASSAITSISNGVPSMSAEPSRSPVQANVLKNRGASGETSQRVTTSNTPQAKTSNPPSNRTEKNVKGPGTSSTPSGTAPTSSDSSGAGDIRNVRKSQDSLSLSPSVKQLHDEAAQVRVPQNTASAEDSTLSAKDLKQSSTEKSPSRRTALPFEMMLTHELQDYLRKNHLDDSGTRSELLDRCTARNNDFVSGVLSREVLSGENSQEPGNETLDGSASSEWLAPPHSVASDGPPKNQTSTYKETFKALFGFGSN